MGRPSKEKSSAELPRINKTRNSSYPLNLGDMKKERNRDNETERQLAKLANVGHTAYHQYKRPDEM